MAAEIASLDTGMPKAWNYQERGDYDDGKNISAKKAGGGADRTRMFIKKLGGHPGGGSGNILHGTRGDLRKKGALESHAWASLGTACRSPTKDSLVGDVG
jgi:hypothetical protein